MAHFACSDMVLQASFYPESTTTLSVLATECVGRHLPHQYKQRVDVHVTYFYYYTCLSSYIVNLEIHGR